MGQQHKQAGSILNMFETHESNDTIAIAGQRLIRSLIYNMDGLDENETTNPIFENENWQEEWNPSTNILDAFIEVRGSEE